MRLGGTRSVRPTYLAVDVGYLPGLLISNQGVEERNAAYLRNSPVRASGNEFRDSSFGRASPVGGRGGSSLVSRSVCVRVFLCHCLCASVSHYL